MPRLEILSLVVFAVALALAALALFAVVRHSRSGRAARELGRGRFAEALAAGAGAAGRDELYAAAVAAKHLLRWEEAGELLRRILAEDPEDGEAALELGLVSAYRGDLPAAERHLVRAAALRADLAESITLHRAWVALRGGDQAAARRLFEEVEASLESKLRSDLGGGDPLFAEWFLQAGALWQALGDPERGRWARREGRAAAASSRLAAAVGAFTDPA